MLWSDIKGRKVVSTASAERVGKVKEIVVDGVAHQVAGFVLKRTQSGSVLPWADVQGLGADALTVASGEVVVDADERVDALRDKRDTVLGKRVLSVLGDELGTVKDLDVEPSTGTVVSLVLERRSVPGTDVRGVGSYAVVVAAQP